MPNLLFSQPLAARMRPERLDEFVGQTHIIGKGKLLYRAIKADRLPSMIFYGPPGTGKTTLARIIANETKYEYRTLNAVSAGVKDIREVVNETYNDLLNPGGKTVLFFDEIHRLNKSQQDALLPYVEDGVIILIGSTTENPYFEVNNALLSRSTIFKFQPLTRDDISNIIDKCLTDTKKGFGEIKVTLTQKARDHFITSSQGDARVCMNALELAVLTTDKDADGIIYIDIETAEECIRQKALRYDKDGDEHYDVISAFIKSMRNYVSPDAVLHYLARMIESGEKPEFIARRIMICAAEDVGLANPAALQVAVAASLAVERVGWPEGAIILSEAALMVGCSPKSNSVLGIFDAIDDVKNIDIGSIPEHLKDAHYAGAKNFGHGVDYKYSHNYEKSHSPNEFLPKKLADKQYYYPKNSGYEAKIIQRILEVAEKDKNNK